LSWNDEKCNFWNWSRFDWHYVQLLPSATRPTKKKPARPVIHRAPNFCWDGASKPVDTAPSGKLSESCLLPCKIEC
jgi:hypothetical protein